ncbi:DUF7507 domain-containing protein [Aureitalea marina]|uniref:DUF7507 domain-containing protein n=1 Tax=Aureitalea marina TaxID=930804 RepID=A0A2S7KQC1_9FLAO|nr:gliding motility-associated C-terminal domain-containing protein [Aureitalea marina]PQB04811.1 hypothetical protein BST85_07795 [Aureitalea marina]
MKEADYDIGGDCSSVGDEITYTFTVYNTGNVSLSNVEVEDLLLGGILAGPDSGDNDNDGLLDVNEEWIYTGSYLITQADIDAGVVLNQATASAIAPDQSPVSDLSGSAIDTDDVTETELCQQADIAVVKIGELENPDECSSIGDTINYQFLVSNKGNVSLSDIELIDDLLGGVVAGPISGDTDNDGQLDVTEQWIYEASYTITQDDIDAGEVVNQATVTGLTQDQTEVSDQSGTTVDTDDATETDLCQEPAIAIVKTASYDDGGDCSEAGKPIIYTFAVSNEGNVTLSNVVVNDPLLGGELAGPDSGDTDGDGLLDLDEIWIYSATYTITQDDIEVGTVTNQATATAIAPDQTEVSDLSGSAVDNDDPTETELCQNPGIALIKEFDFIDLDDNDCPTPGDLLLYSFQVANTGNQALTNVTITDPLVDVVGGPIDLDIGEIDTMTFTAEYEITLQDLIDGEVVNQATATGTTTDGQDVSDLSDNDSFLEDDPTIFSTGCVITLSVGTLEVEKTGTFNDENGDGNTQVGETITFNFAVTNTGSLPLYNIQLDDPLPGVVITGGPIEELLPGETDDDTFEGSYVITQEDIINGEVVNQATATAENILGQQITDLSDDPNDSTDIDEEGDGDPDDPTVTVLPIVLSNNFEIFNAISPDGDGLNDFMVIQGIEDYPQNNFKVFNRWGVQVFEVDGYDNNSRRFEGISEGRTTIQQGKRLPSGTYYYVLTFPGDNPGQSAYQGYLYINRN